MSHTQNAQNTPNTPSHKRHSQFPQNNHRNNHKNANRGSDAFSNNRPSLTCNRSNLCNRTGGHRNSRSSNHTMVNEMSQGEEPLEECDCNEGAEPLRRKGSLAAQSPPLVRIQKTKLSLNHILLSLFGWEGPHIYLFLVKMIL